MVLTKSLKNALKYSKSGQKVGTLFVRFLWWRCGELHSGLARFVKVFYILIRRFISEKPRPSAGFDFSLTTLIPLKPPPSER